MKNNLKIIYFLSTIGDFCYSLLLTACIIHGTKIGGTQTETGWIGGGYGFTYLIAPTILGRLSDKIPRKASLLIASCGQILIAIYYLFFIDSIFQLILGQILLGTVYGFWWPSIEAYISEKTHNTPESHQRGMANFCIAWSIGYMSGPVVAGALSDYNDVYSFIIAIIVYSIGFILIVFGIPMQKITKVVKNVGSVEDVTVKNETSHNKSDNSNSNNQIMLKILFTMLIYALIAKVVMTYFTDFAVRPETLNYDGKTVATVMFFLGIGRLVYFIFGRFNKHQFFRSSFTKLNYSFLIIAASLIFITQILNPILMGINLFFFGFFAGLIYLSALDLLIIQKQKGKSTIAGLFESTIGIGAALTPIIAGVLAETNVVLPFYVFAVLALTIFIFNQKVFINKKE